MPKSKSAAKTPEPTQPAPKDVARRSSDRPSPPRLASNGKGKADEPAVAGRQRAGPHRFGVQLSAAHPEERGRSGREADSPFLRKQKKRLLVLRDAMLDSMSGVAQDNLRARAEGNEASAFGMHQADAGSDAYDRDFALNLLSQEQDALYEIDEALKRIELGTYGTCEMSGKPINHERLEAIPFTRFTVESQSQLERQNKAQRVRQSVTSPVRPDRRRRRRVRRRRIHPETKE